MKMLDQERKVEKVSMILRRVEKRQRKMSTILQMTKRTWKKIWNLTWRELGLTVSGRKFKRLLQHKKLSLVRHLTAAFWKTCVNSEK
jgi:hypothetical protein